MKTSAKKRAENALHALGREELLYAHSGGVHARPEAYERLAEFFEEHAEAKESELRVEDRVLFLEERVGVLWERTKETAQLPIEASSCKHERQGNAPGIGPYCLDCPVADGIDGSIAVTQKTSAPVLTPVKDIVDWLRDPGNGLGRAPVIQRIYSHIADDIQRKWGGT